MSAASPYTPITELTIGAADRKENAISAEIWRTANGVGSFKAVLRNTGNLFGGVGFDIQNNVIIDINSVPIFEGWIDGTGTTFQLLDAEGDTTEYLIVEGYDRMQDFLFHNNFEYLYPEWCTGCVPPAIYQIKDILDDVINTQIGVGGAIGQTNISYTSPVGATPNVGGFEFKEGNSFLGAIQELHRRANWLFFVQDTIVAGPPPSYPLNNGAPGFNASAVILTEGQNILSIDWNRRRGDKLYNWVKLYGKNPMFDAYTEYNASVWTAFPAAGNPTDDSATTRVGSFSIRVQNQAAPGAGVVRLTLSTPASFNYATWDFSKGRIGVWALYDDPGGAYGTNQRMALNCRLTDNGGAQIDYFEGAAAAAGKTRLWRDEWGYCEFPLGEDINYTGAVNISGEWCSVAGVTFDWANVVTMAFQLPRPGAAVPDPGNLYLDGLTIPLPPISIVNNAGSEGTYRRRPYLDSRPDIRTQLALDSLATSILNKHEITTLDYMKIKAVGNTGLHYGGQSVTIIAPSLGISAPGDVYYMTEIHHIIEPRKDVSGGYGWDYITEIEAVPIDTRAPDFSRFNTTPIKSAYQVGRASGVGLKVK